jgi:ketosteroid isomerase-like protein
MSALEDVAAVARSWEAACRALDNARIVSHLSEDATVWYNFDKDKKHDRAGYRTILDQSMQQFWNQQYKDMRVHLHPGGFVEQATLVGETANGVVETPFMLVATVAGGKITKIEEYFDTTPKT